MRILALAILFAACSAPPKKTADQLDTGSGSDTCCCKSTPSTSEDGKPIYENINRMECSGKQGTCVPDVQCNGSAQP